MRSTFQQLEGTLEQIHDRAQELRRQREGKEDNAPAPSDGHQMSDCNLPEVQFESLVSEFRDVWEQIKKHDEELDHRRQHLEHEVSQRTADQQKANRDLASAYAEMEWFCSSIPSIVVGIDACGCVTRWNAAAAQAFGLKDSSATGRHL